MENQMTIREVLETDVKILEKLEFTTADIDRFGIPIMDVLKSLKVCINAIDMAEKQEQKKAEAEEVTENVGESSESGPNE